MKFVSEQRQNLSSPSRRGTDDHDDQNVVFNTGVKTVNLECGAGYTPIAPGIQVAGGRAYVIASAPDGPTGRKVTLRVDTEGTTAEVSIRCLSNKTSTVNGASTELQFTPITKTIQVTRIPPMAGG